MKTLNRSARRRSSGGSPLPTVFQGLAAVNALFRRAEFHMIAAQPKIGKSFFMLKHSVEWVRKHDQLVLYFSADSSELVVASRVASMITRERVADSEAQIQRGEGSALEALSSLPGLEFSFDPELTVEVLDLEILAFIEKWGRAPDVVILDNLSDVESESGADEWAGLREVSRMATKLARKMGPAVIALHHTSEDDNVKPGKAPSRKKVQGKVSVKQALVLTLGEITNGEMPVAVVANRFGRGDASGNWVIPIKASLDTAQFSDY